jgi:CRISPR system Cascade subunit CasE
MLYLSRLILNEGSETVQRDLNDCHQLHRRILSAFPDQPAVGSPRDHFGVLYRAEPLEGADQLVRLLVQSAVAPDWSRLPARYLTRSVDERGNPAVRLVSEEYAKIRPGMQLMFRLRANPTKRISPKNTNEPTRWHKKRVELRHEKDLLDWIKRKGEHGGFQVLGITMSRNSPDTRIETLEKDRGWQQKHGRAEPMELSFGAVLFEGRLEVTDQELFLTTLQSGLGSGKAFGFGLLSIATAR